MKEDSENILNDEFYDDNNDLLDENDADSVEKLDDPEPFYNQMNGEFEFLCCFLWVSHYRLAFLLNLIFRSFDKIDGQEKNIPVNNKTDWPKIPQVPVMSNIPNTNSFNNVNSNTPFNDMAYKLDQVLGNGFIIPQIVSLPNLMYTPHTCRVHADAGLSNI